MSNLAEMYGEFHSVYRGVGKLNGSNCEFEIGQQSEGDIYLRCHSQELLPNEKDDIELIGFADEGPVQVKGKVIRITVTGNYDHYYCNAGKLEMNVGELDWGKANTVTFAITNFKFIGNEREEYSTGGWRRTDLRLKLDGVNISFQKVEMYDSIIESLARNKNTEITCELAIEVGNHAQEEIIEIVDRVCSLLTIARGTKINWISYTLRDDGGVKLGQCFRPRITRPYTQIPLVKSLNDPASIVRFLRQCYPTFVDENPHYHFDHLGNFLADVHSRVFLETRCLLLFSVVEVLARRTSKNGSLRKVLRDFVDCHELPVQKCQKKKCGRKCGTCESKCDRYQHQCEDDCEIGIFVNDRNKMVHGMEFSDSDFSSGYYRNLHLLHLMILRALDYRGEYYDRSKGGSVWA